MSSSRTSEQRRQPRARDTRPSRRVTALDGLRVLAMIAIVVYHANVKWLPGGFIGVTVFFTLSGYLIGDSLLREVRRAGTIDILKFYKRRIVRLMPLMMAVITVTALLSAVLAPQLLEKMRGDALPALFFYENWWYIFREQSYFAASGLPSPITHFWFLSVLGQFYLVIPWIIIMLSSVVRSRTTQRRVIAVPLVATAILAAVLYNPSGDPSRVYYGTDTRLPEILVGVWLAYAWPTDTNTGFSRAVTERVPQPLLDLLGLASIGALGYLCFIVNGYSSILYRGGLLLVAVLTAIVIAAVTRPSSILAVPLGIPPLSFIAARSFGIYLWHFPLLLLMNPATRTTELPWWGWALEALAIIVATEISYQLVEKPFSGRGKSDSRGTRDTRDGRGSRSSRDPYPTQGPSRLLIGGWVLGGLVCVAAAALLAIGPFWYVDGAKLQAERTQQDQQQSGTVESQSGQGASAPSTEGAPAPTDEASFTHIGEGIDTEGHKAAQAVVDVAVALERRIRGYEIDPETGKTNAPVILIGDSVPAGAIDQFYEIFPYGYIDAEVGRQLYVADDVYLDAVAMGYDKEVVVFASGDNGVADDDDMQHLLDAAAGHQIYLVTVRVPLQLQDMNNELFKEYAAKYDNVNIIDWYAESEGHDEYFWDDGTHLRPEGAEAYVLMLRREIVGE